MIKEIIEKVIVSRRKEIPFMIFFWFLLSFLGCRVWVFLMTSDIIPQMYLSIKGIHVHHLNYGIAIISIIGFIGLSFPNFTKKHIHGLSIFYGIGLGLAFDEFSLWLLLDDNYWARQSYDAVIILSLIFLNIIYFKGFWAYIARKMHLHKITQLKLFKKE